MILYNFSKFPLVYEIKNREHVVPHQRPRRQQSPMWPAVDLGEKLEKFMDADERIKSSWTQMRSGEKFRDPQCNSLKKIISGNMILVVVLYKTCIQMTI